MNTPNTTLGTAPKAKKKFCLAAIPFLVYALTCGVGFLDYLFITCMSRYDRTIDYANSYYSSYFGEWYYDYTWGFYGFYEGTTITLSITAALCTLLMFAAMAFLVVLLFMKKRNAIISVPFFVAAVSTALGMLGNIICLFFFDTDAELCYELFTLGTYLVMTLAFAVAGVFAILAAKKGGKLIKILSFVPAGLSVISGILYLVKWIVFLVCDDIIYLAPAILVTLFVSIPLTAALLLGCFWIANPEKKNKAQAVEAAPVMPVM